MTGGSMRLLIVMFVDLDKGALASCRGENSADSVLAVTCGTTATLTGGSESPKKRQPAGNTATAIGIKNFVRMARGSVGRRNICGHLRASDGSKRDVSGAHCGERFVSSLAS